MYPVQNHRLELYFIKGNLVVFELTKDDHTSRNLHGHRKDFGSIVLSACCKSDLNLAARKASIH